MALQGWEKKQYELEEQLDKASEIINSLMIAGSGGSPGQPYTPSKEDPKNPYVPAPSRKLASANNIRKTNRPLGNDDDYGRGNVPGHPDWKISGGPQLPDFKPMGRVIKGRREGVLPMNETKIKQPLQIKQASAASRQIRDRLKPFTKGKGYDDAGGSLRGIPDALRIQLLRDAMAQNLPANNIRRLQDTGHVTIPDPDNPGRLKIIDSLGPQA